MLFDDKTVLVTGGTGSLGRVLVRRVLSGQAGTPRKVIVLSRDEAKQHDMRLAYTQKRFTTDEVIYANFEQVLEFRIGDIRDFADVCSAVRDADIVVNAAALKQVPTCEYQEESRHTYRRGDHLGIAPMLPELKIDGGSGAPAIDAEFNSTANILSLEETVELLREHHLVADVGAPVATGDGLS